MYKFAIHNKEGYPILCWSNFFWHHNGDSRRKPMVVPNLIEIISDALQNYNGRMRSSGPIITHLEFDSEEDATAFKIKWG